MYKVTVPISFNTINEENASVYVESAKKSGVYRVFFGGFGDICDPNSILYKDTERLQKIVNIFKENNFEVGIWVCAFGHGAALLHQREYSDTFRQMVGVDGRVGTHANCPSDENFKNAYCEAVRRIALLGPDLIMFDDDYRFNWRGCYYMGCFCSYHLKEFYKKIGEEVPLEKIEELIYTGGKNKYRTAYRELMRGSLIDFAKALRETVDKVNSSIRMGICSTPDNYDNSGTDMIELSKTIAGNTKPFTRIFHAPYDNINIIPAIETARMQFNWLEGTGIECFAEGDVYPRPRYNVPSKVLELFDFALIANGKGDGILNYVYDYSQKPDYETGYVDRYIKNKPIRDKINELFTGKKTIGVSVFNVIHKVENQEFPDVLFKETVRKLLNIVSSPARFLISQNSIPTTYDKGEYPLLLLGENARYVNKEALSNGAILDIHAAKILIENGIDTGLVSYTPAKFDGEYFIKDNDIIRNINNTGLMKIECNKNAEVLSIFKPDNTPAAYLYENKDGLKFYVLAYDMFYEAENYNRNYSNSYYRQSQVIDATHWLCGKKLPATCTKNPGLYILSSKDESAMSVMLLNISLDDILSPEIKLDKEYKEIKFVNCSGTLNGDTVTLSDITPYGIAMFEVK